MCNTMQTGASRVVFPLNIVLSSVRGSPLFFRLNTQSGTANAARAFSSPFFETQHDVSLFFSHINIKMCFIGSFFLAAGRSLLRPFRLSLPMGLRHFYFQDEWDEYDTPPPPYARHDVDALDRPPAYVPRPRGPPPVSKPPSRVSFCLSPCLSHLRFPLRSPTPSRMC